MEFEILDPVMDKEISSLRVPVGQSGKLTDSLTQTFLSLHRALSRRKKISIPDPVEVPSQSVFVVASRDYLHRMSAISEEVIYSASVLKKRPVLRATIYQICTVAGGGTLTSTLSWRAHTRGAAEDKTFSPTDIDLSVYGEAQGASVVFVPESDITFQTAIAAPSGSPEYSVWVRLEEIAGR